MKGATLRKPQTTDRSGHGDAAKVVLLNDDWHTFDEVAGQLVKATKCTYSRGLALANVVHHTGSAIVYSGPVERCEAVAMVLEAIRLKVLVEK